MKAMLALLVGVMSASALLADGYPFNSDTQEVFVDTIRLRLSDEQELEVAKFGRVTLLPEQRTSLLRIYANLPAQLQVASATFNDSREDFDESRVDCFWVAPQELALTLLKKAGAGGWTYASGPQGMQPPHLRLSSAGKIYAEGKELTLAQALKLIETAPTMDGDGGGDRLVHITLPPSYRLSPEDADHEYAVANRKVAEIFVKLKEHSQTHKVTLDQTW